MSLIAEAPGFLQVYSNGSVKRFSPEIALPSTHPPSNGYDYKDVIIHPSKPITARIFLPHHHHSLSSTSSSSPPSLPVLIYFHGGGFCIGSTTWLGYHKFLADFSISSQSIVLSIDYRLAPEHRLPTAYEDCYASLQWLHDQAGSEPWLRRADLSRVFLAGDSAGGNIAHHVAVKSIHQKIDEVRIRGILPIHPYFGSEKRTKKEEAEESAEDVRMNDMFWRLSIPEGWNRDYYGCNFEIGGKMCSEDDDDWCDFPAVEVYVAGKDFLKERGVMYVEFLKKKGVKEVKLVEAEEEGHVFHVFYPESESTRLLQTQMTHFIHTH